MRTAKSHVIIRHIIVLSLLISLGMTSPGYLKWLKADCETTADGLPNLRGEAALTHLKERGLYSSLSEAVKAARNNAQPLPLNPASPNLPNGAVGAPFNGSFTMTGGTAPFSFSVTNGALPGGLTLDAATGALSGAPTSRGTYNFVIRATDNSGCTGRRPYQIVVN